MKITFISPPPNLSGGNRVIAIHADLLTKRGHDVTVVAQKRRKPSRLERLRALSHGRWLREPARRSHFDAMAARLLLMPYAGPVAAEDIPDADVVIATWWETAFMVAQFPREKGRKFYFVQHHEVHSHLPVHLAAGSYYLPLKKIAIASWLVELMRNQYCDNNVALVPNAVDHNLFFARERDRQRVPTVGVMYAPTSFKGTDIALKAIELARNDHPNLRVVAFGASRPTRELSLPPGTEFHLRPPQDKLREIYASCDVFIAASRSEGFGLPILEAMACRTPVVATRTGCAPDVIREGIEGFVAEVNDAAGLATGLSHVLSMDQSAWSTMSKAAATTAQTFSWENASNLFERALSNDRHKF